MFCILLVWIWHEAWLKRTVFALSAIRGVSIFLVLVCIFISPIFMPNLIRFFFFHVFPSTFNWIRLIWLISVVNSVALLLIVIKSIVFADIQVTQKNERKVESEKISLQITLLMNAIQFAIRNSQHSNQSVWPTKIHIEDNESYITGTAPGTVLVQ